MRFNGPYRWISLVKLHNSSFSKSKIHGRAFIPKAPAFFHQCCTTISKSQLTSSFAYPLQHMVVWWWAARILNFKIHQILIVNPAWHGNPRSIPSGSSPSHPFNVKVLTSGCTSAGHASPSAARCRMMDAQNGSASTSTEPWTYCEKTWREYKYR